MGLVERDFFEISSAVSSVKIGAGSSGSSTTNFAINTNNPYILIMTDVEIATDNQPLNMRVTESGTSQTDSEYDISYSFLKAYASFSESGTANEAQWFLAQLGTPTQEQQNGVITIYNAFDSNEHTMFQHESSYWTSISKLAGAIGSGVYTQASSVDGFEIFAGSGNIDAGKFVLYEVT
jgi:hypothetical protein